MARRSRAAIALSGAGVLASIVAVSLAAGGLTNSGPLPTQADPTTAQVESNTRALAKMYGQDPVRFRNDGEEGFTVSLEDLGRQMTAFFARAKGEPHEPADLMAPAHNDAGQVVGYKVANVGFVSKSQAQRPDFDLCTLEIQAREKEISNLARLKADGYFERQGLDPALVQEPPPVPCTPGR